MPEPRDFREAPVLETTCSVADTVIEPYQRKLLTRHIITAIKDDFRWEKFGRPLAYILSTEPPRYAIVDGQHRVTAVRELWGENAEIPITLIKHGEYKDRAELFVQMADNRTPLHQLDKFHAELEAGRPEAVEINRITEAAGARIGQRGGNSSPIVISAIAALKRAYRFGPDVLERTLNILHDTWEHDAYRHLSVNIMGVATFIYTYPGARDERIIMRLTILSDRAGGAKAIQRGVTEIRGYSTGTNSIGRVAASVVGRAYNTKLLTKNKLDLSKLLPED